MQILHIALLLLPPHFLTHFSKVHLKCHETVSGVMEVGLISRTVQLGPASPVMKAALPALQAIPRCGDFQDYNEDIYVQGCWKSL